MTCIIPPVIETLPLDYISILLNIALWKHEIARLWKGRPEERTAVLIGSPIKTLTFNSYSYLL